MTFQNLIKIYSFVIFTFYSFTVFSQDIIVKNNKDTIFCNVLEIGTKYIKYDSTKYSDNTIFEINRDEVLKIFFKNTEELKFHKDSLDFNIYADNKKNALKFHLLSVSVGHVAISYERNITLWASLEFGASFIYGRYQYQRTEIGGTARLGYKFIKLRDYAKHEVRFLHIMKGTYLKPEFIFSSFSSSYDYINEYGSTRTHIDNVYSYALLINYGVQYVYDNAFLLDFYAGIGAGISSGETDFYYSNISIPYERDEFNFCITMGVKIGGLF